MKVSTILLEVDTHKPYLQYFTGGSFICPGQKSVEDVNRVVSDTKKMLEGYYTGVKNTELHTDDNVMLDEFFIE